MTLLFLSLSLGLVGTWAYHLYDKTVYSNRKTVVYIKDTVAVKRAIRDSLQKVYSATIQDLPAGMDSIRTSMDALKEPGNSQEDEIYALNKEIGNLLKKNDLPDIDLVLARQKIIQLQQKVEEFRNQNCDMKEEMRKLNTTLEKLTADMKGLEENMQRLAIKK
jgi:peptidoglycan hydrolase CwlO-like protein